MPLGQRDSFPQNDYLAIFSIFLCVLVRYFFYAIVILLPLSIIMPTKSKSGSKLSSAEAVEKGDEDAEFASVSVIRELLQSQERMFKNFVESIAANLTKRVDDLVTKIADLKASLEFSQNDIDKHKTQITLLDTNLQSTVEEITKFQTLGAKQLEKATYLENQSRRNNVRIEGIVEELGESWESTEGKVKEMFTEKLQMDSPPAIECAHRTGKGKKPDGMPKPRTVVCKLYDWKKREAILKAARRIKPHGIHIYEDLAEETMATRRELLPKLKRAKEEGKIAYFSYDKLVIKDRPSGASYSPGSRSIYMD